MVKGVPRKRLVQSPSSEAKEWQNDARLKVRPDAWIR
jgi:hypothetical protein